MKKIVFFLFLCISILSCEKDTEFIDVLPQSYCWRCDRKTTVYKQECYSETGGIKTTVSGSIVSEFVCNMTDKDALSYEDTWKGVYTSIVGNKDNIPCDYVRIDTYHTSMVCYKQGVN